MNIFTFIVAFVLSAVFCIPADQVLYKLDGLRYQYVTDEEGRTQLEDVWVKTTDLLKASRFNPGADIIYHLFTRTNPTVSQPIVPGNLDDTNFDPEKKVIVLLHGWRGNSLSPMNVELVPAILGAEDVNVIVVDWSAAFDGDYVAGVASTLTAARGIAGFINWLNSQSGASPSRYHIIGHGFGGHQAGMVGRNVAGDVAYITALDPTLIGFTNGEHNLNSRDGAYTEVIHTNVFGFGYVWPIGHVDFYPNGGIRMAGCDAPECDHSRAYEYMVESIRSGGFTGRRCPTMSDAFNGQCTLPETLRMGGLQPKTGSTGIFHTVTNEEPPFSRG